MSKTHVRRAPKLELTEGQFERLLAIGAQLALIAVGIFVAIAVLLIARAVLIPIGLAIVVGLVFGPIADWVERRGVPPAVSGLFAVMLLLGIIAAAIFAFAAPLSEWLGKLPAIWTRVQTELLNWREPLQAISGMLDQVASTLGSDGAVEVKVQDPNQVFDTAMIAPMAIGDILLFLVSFYFYIATRDSIRVSILSLCVTRRMRWRTAHIFNDIESKVSRFLLTVTLLNIGVAIAVALMAWGLGLPSPLLWGALAGVLNYIPYVGQATMIGVLVIAGLGTQPDITHVLLPVAGYLAINLVEGHFLFPQLVGRAMLMNPFLIFLSIVFWIWVWGPIGSLMAVPALIILSSVISNTVPIKDVKPRRPVRRTAAMTDRDLVLANAARAIRERLAKDSPGKAQNAATAAAPSAAIAAAPAVARAPRARRASANRKRPPA